MFQPGDEHLLLPRCQMRSRPVFGEVGDGGTGAGAGSAGGGTGEIHGLPFLDRAADSSLRRLCRSTDSPRGAAAGEVEPPQPYPSVGVSRTDEVGTVVAQKLSPGIEHTYDHRSQARTASAGGENPRRSNVDAITNPAR